MKFIKLSSLCLMVIVYSGCQTVVKKEVEPAPENFVIEQDSTDSLAALGQLSGYDHQVTFKRHQFSISESEKARILAWIQAAKPGMIGVRGTGGAERHRDLGNSRAAAIIEFIQSQHIVVDAVILDYDARLLGGRGLISVIPDSLADQVKTSAPILIISSN